MMCEESFIENFFICRWFIAFVVTFSFLCLVPKCREQKPVQFKEFITRLNTIEVKYSRWQISFKWLWCVFFGVFLAVTVFKYSIQYYFAFQPLEQFSQRRKSRFRSQSAAETNKYELSFAPRLRYSWTDLLIFKFNCNEKCLTKTLALCCCFGSKLHLNSCILFMLEERLSKSYWNLPPTTDTSFSKAVILNSIGQD